MKQFVSDLSVGGAASSLFSVKYKRPVTEYKKGWRFVVGLSDKTGEIECNFWGGGDKAAVERVFGSFKEGDVVRVSAAVGEYEGKAKLDIDPQRGSIGRVSEFDVADFVPISKRDIAEMRAELMSAVQSVQNPFLRKLLDCFFGDKKFIDEFCRAPGAIYYHHAWVGGLLEHSLHVYRLCMTACDIYPSIDRDLVTTAALLHDVGKTREFSVTTNIRQTEEGMLCGHITIGAEMVSEKIKGIAGFPEVLKMKMVHCIISHHGELEYGTPKTPQFPEASLVYHADLLDSQIDQFVKTRDEAKTEDFRVWTKSLGDIYLK
ncbi:phosphohydrolase [Candidatus Micrarchaeota archaeon CG08_land_8_20_14_0_20_59_11]|nr:MAG: phosphohydrolase [Candidatus Micrarchaeota archaeon CG08_land_8_20_14_0_20_59_11]PIT85092.1 MAG: phosphohydrolase [Candidatus Micrarchaeota archaeon CG10_big_fil_rev_8_21_14_0_10_59_7]